MKTTSYALLREGGVRDVLSDHIRRCTGYQSIAVRGAGAAGAAVAAEA